MHMATLAKARYVVTLAGTEIFKGFEKARDQKV